MKHITPYIGTVVVVLVVLAIVSRVSFLKTLVTGSNQ